MPLFKALWWKLGTRKICLCCCFTVIDGYLTIYQLINWCLWYFPQIELLLMKNVPLKLTITSFFRNLSYNMMFLRRPVLSIFAVLFMVSNSELGENKPMKARFVTQCMHKINKSLSSQTFIGEFRLILGTAVR